MFNKIIYMAKVPFFGQGFTRTTPCVGARLFPIWLVAAAWPPLPSLSLCYLAENAGVFTKGRSPISSM